IAGDRHHRPSAERAALCVAPQHHEGEEEAHRRKGAGRLRRRHRAAAQGVEGDRAAKTPGRREGQDRGRADRQVEKRSGGDLMASLVIAEHDNRILKDATAKTVTAAAQLGAPVHVLVAGKDCAAVAESAAKLSGVVKVLVADADVYEKMLAEEMEALILSLSSGYDAFLAPATTDGK